MVPEQQETGFDERSAAFANDPLRHALSVRSAMWPDVRTGLGEPDTRWTTAAELFASDAAIDDYLDYTASIRKGADPKTCAASMIGEYSYLFSIATVPLFIGFGIVPELDPLHFAMTAHTAPPEHDGGMLRFRHSHVGFLSSGFWTDDAECAAHPDARGLLDGDGLCDLYRRSVEDHFAPFVETLFRKTGLTRNALWRLVGDAIAGQFLDVGRHFARRDAAKAAAMTILKRPGSPLNNRQLYYFDLTLRDGQQHDLVSWTFRARGGCCRFYLLEGSGYCETCVLKKPTERDADLLEIMRHRYAGLTGITP